MSGIFMFHARDCRLQIEFGRLYAVNYGKLVSLCRDNDNEDRNDGKEVNKLDCAYCCDAMCVCVISLNSGLWYVAIGPFTSARDVSLYILSGCAVLLSQVFVFLCPDPIPISFAQYYFAITFWTATEKLWLI